MAAVDERRAAIREARETRRTQHAARRHKRGYANISRTAQRNLPFRQRMMELSTSATFASITTVLLTMGLVVMTSFLSEMRMVLFPTVTVLGSWAILGTAKMLEGRGQGWSNKRLAFLTTGVLVGTAAWFVTSNLFITFQQGTDGELGSKTNFLTTQIVLTDAVRAADPRRFCPVLRRAVLPQALGLACRCLP